MIIHIRRLGYEPDKTLGFYTAQQEIRKTSGFSVEPPWKDNLPFVSCIPEGTYEAYYREGGKNGSCLELLDVPGRTVIQIHVANLPEELQGCIAVGKERIARGVGRSADAVIELLNMARLADKIHVKITNLDWHPDPDTQDRPTVEPLPTAVPRVPPEWTEPVDYQPAKKKFIARLKKHLRRKEMFRAAWSLLQLTALLRFPVLNKMLYALSIIYPTNQTNQTTTLMEEDKSTLKWIKTRLKEPTTWMGFITLAGVAGITLEVAIVQAVALFVASGIGVILVLKKEYAEKED